MFSKIELIVQMNKIEEGGFKEQLKKIINEMDRG